MDSDEGEQRDGISVSMNIEGEYTDVMSKLRTEASGSRLLDPLVEDADELLETVQRINGGTRSALARQIAETSSLSDDPDAVVELLQVLERYDLVTLEGNTWMPGSRLQEVSQ